MHISQKLHLACAEVGLVVCSSIIPKTSFHRGFDQILYYSSIKTAFLFLSRMTTIIRMVLKSLL